MSETETVMNAMTSAAEAADDDREVHLDLLGLVRRLGDLVSRCEAFERSQPHARDGDPSRKVVQQLQQGPATTPRDHSPKFPTVPVSLSFAARFLGVSLWRTLLPAVRTGIVRTSRRGKRDFICPEELRRLAADGIVRAKSVARPRKHAKPPADLGEEVARVLRLRVGRPARPRPNGAPLRG